MTTTKMPPVPQYVWRGRCVNVVDGDTIDCELDVGFHTVLTQRLRLYGIDTPEIHGTTKVAGLDAMEYTHVTLATWQADGLIKWPLIIETYKTDSFGRFLATVFRVGVTPSLNDLLIVNGYAEVFFP